jgi:photosystem II stability/assembly factor-like uncharacterized protein
MKTIYAGTKKGLFVFNKREKWECDVHFQGQSVFSVGIFGGRVWASPFTEWTGSSLMYSDDGGENWEKKDIALKFPEKTDTALAKVWQMVSDRNGRMFFGVEPSALFTSDDAAESWQLCEGLWNHPHREKWTPGFGGQCLHTIIPLSDKTWIVGMSTGGVYRTEDSGATWEACNQKIVAPFMPDKLPEFGQCVHKIAYHPTNPERLFLQHHWGVYRSDNAGRTWDNISEGKGLPTDFGFGIVTTKPDHAFIIPIKADEFRVFPDGKARVYRTTDGGESWDALSEGLPQENAYDCVLRDSFNSDGENLAFGTTGGSLYFSDDEGESWDTIADHLPRITCVRIGGRAVV